MISIRFPQPDFKITATNGREMIYDAYRKKYVALTPEEWVRQNFLNYLVKAREYPGALLSIEKELHWASSASAAISSSTPAKPPLDDRGMQGNGRPLKQPVLEQIVRYHMALPAPGLSSPMGSTLVLPPGRSGRQLGL